MNCMASRLVSQRAVAAGQPDNQDLPNAMLWFQRNAHNNTRDSWLPIHVVPFADAVADIHHERRLFALHRREYPDGKSVRKIDNAFVGIVNWKSHPDDHEDNQRCSCLIRTQAQARKILIKKSRAQKRHLEGSCHFHRHRLRQTVLRTFHYSLRNNVWNEDQLGRCQARSLVEISARPTHRK